MRLSAVALSELAVNKSNDRHGELKSELAAITWLFDTHEQHMRNLARDIVSQNRVYEPPLVSKSGSKYLVFDGNRRVTCLKLLSEPNKAPTAELKAFFAVERERWIGNFPTKIECEVEDDRDAIDEILFRRHTGSQSGVGRSKWDDAAKDNFIARTGRHDGSNVAEAIERKLIECGAISKEGQLPRTVLKRLLSSEEFRNQFGITLKDRKLFFSHNPQKSLSALDRIAADMISKRVVLGDLWDNDAKRRYIAELRDESVLPKSSDRMSAPVPFDTAKATKRKQHPPKQPTSMHSRDLRRATLIPTDLPFDLSWTGKTTRLREIWNELQKRLLLDKHPNSIAVIFRVLLELSIDHYISSFSDVEIHASDTLAKKAEKVAAHQLTRNAIDEKYRREIMKFAHSESVISANTMNRYVHSVTFSPSPKHLTALWDTLSHFIVTCINSERFIQRSAA